MKIYKSSSGGIFLYFVSSLHSLSKSDSKSLERYQILSNLNSEVHRRNHLTYALEQIGAPDDKIKTVKSHMKV